MKSIKQVTAISAALLGFGVAPAASALDLTYIEGTLTPAPYVTYGDGNSYSLPVLALLYDAINGGGTGPGNPYYITSTPGAIKDLTVIGTGASGGPVNTNFSGMDDAYPTPNSDGIPFFSTGTTADPGGTGEFTGDEGSTWDVRLTSLMGFTGGDAPVFFFNNNQTNSGGAEDQNLAIWAALTLYDDANLLQPLTFYFTNDGAAYAPYNEGGGGDLYGSAGTGTLGTPSEPLAGDNTNTDYVLSGGQLCMDAAFAPVLCDGNEEYLVNHNLGANQAVYAVVFPAMNDILLTSGFTGYDVMSLDWRMGCDPDTIDPATNCIGRSLNNGYEQLFIGSIAVLPPPNGVPEPATLALLGSALLGFAAMRRRKQT